VFTAGSVNWNLGNLVPNSGGRERVTVQVDALVDGTLLLVDAATLSGDINFLPIESRAMAVSRVGPGSLELELEVVPNPVMTNQLLKVDISINNLPNSLTGTLTMRVLWPAELDQIPNVTDGGVCPAGSCQAGEYLFWDLGVLGPETSVTVSFNETVRSSVVDGTLIPLEVELFEGGLSARNISQTALVNPFDDYDGDGIPDVFDEDDDNDDMPDWWENLHGLDPFDPSDAGDDPDMDGLTNLDEYLAGTDPFVNNDFIFKDGFESDEK
jgi:hypothetical protein